MLHNNMAICIRKSFSVFINLICSRVILGLEKKKAATTTIAEHKKKIHRSGKNNYK